ncbi:MAG: hypothetical protein AAF125_04660, partial [Chloroflexota bacterium]
MNNRIRVLLSFLTVAAVALGAFAFVLSSGPAVDVVQAQACETAADSYTIGFANLTEDIVFTQLVRESIEAAAEEAGNVELILADNQL